MPEDRLIGHVFKYDANSGTAYFELLDNLEIGQVVHFKGRVNAYFQTVKEMHVANIEVERAYRGEFVGVPVSQQLHEHDQVYLSV